LAEVILIGSNFKSANIWDREKLHTAASKLEAVLNKLNNTQGILECVIVSTCNRIEYYASVDNVQNGFRILQHFLENLHGLSAHAIENIAYKKSGNLAIKHLLEVVASLDSMVIGENQILGQIRNSYHFARDRNATKSFFNKLFQLAIETGKDVRNRTDIGRGAVSIGSVTVELIKEIFPRDSNCKILLLGAGEIAKVTILNLLKYSGENLTIANRSPERAEELCRKLGGVSGDFDKRYQLAAKHDVIIVSTASSDFILKKGELEKSLQNRRGITFLIDLSVPRNIDPAINEIEHAVLYCVDDLKGVISQNQYAREKVIQDAYVIIDEKMILFNKWREKQSMLPRINELQGIYEQVAEQTLQGYQKQIDKMEKNSQEFVSTVINKFIKNLVNLQREGLNSDIPGSISSNGSSSINEERNIN